MACELGFVNAISAEELTEENKQLFVSLEITPGIFECYYLPSIYEQQKLKLIENKPFVSPYNRIPFTDEHIAKIEEVRKIFVETKKREADELTAQAETIVNATRKKRILAMAKIALEESISYPPLYNFHTSMSDMDNLIDKLTRTSDLKEKQRLYEEFKGILAKGVITPKTKDAFDGTLLFYAIEAENLELIEELWPLSDPNAFTTMYADGGASEKVKRCGYFSKACLTGNTEVIESIISKIGIERCVNDIDENSKSTGLVLVADNTRDPNLVRTLITTIGIDVNKANKYSYTPLMVFARREPFPTQLEILNILIDAGANLEARTSEGQTVLSYIIKYGAPEVIRLLVDRGANINTFDNTLVTPLYDAVTAYSFKEDNINFLIDRGAKLYKFTKKIKNNAVSNNNGKNILIAYLEDAIERDSEIKNGRRVDKMFKEGLNNARRRVKARLEQMPQEDIPSEVIPRPAAIVVNSPPAGPNRQTRRVGLVGRLRTATAAARGAQNATTVRAQSRAPVAARATSRAAAPAAALVRSAARSQSVARTVAPATARSQSVARTVAPAAARAPGTYSRYARKRVGGHRVTYKRRI